LLTYSGVVKVRNFALLLIGATALGVPVAAAQNAPRATGRPLVLQGKCASGGKSAACTSCAVALAQEFKQPARDRALIGSCPKMAAGSYTLSITVPVQLLPAQPAKKTFAQLEASLGATARDQSGRAGGALAETPAVTWSWFGPAGYVIIYQATPVTIDRAAGVDIAVKLRDLRYFVPHRTQGSAHRDGELVVAKAELISLERLPTPGQEVLGAAQEFSAKTLAALVPGHITKKQVEALLGQPWRTDEGDEDEDIPESWDYRGKDASGIYLVHIVFDNRGTATLIVKVPDKTHTALPAAAKTPAGPAKP
jgi:outer membrane protein assembly factor BamE (lipoprotein component of BamABCDE complex)